GGGRRGHQDHREHQHPEPREGDPVGGQGQQEPVDDQQHGDAAEELDPHRRDPAQGAQPGEPAQGKQQPEGEGDHGGDRGDLKGSQQARAEEGEVVGPQVDDPLVGIQLAVAGELPQPGGQHRGDRENGQDRQQQDVATTPGAGGVEQHLGGGGGLG